MYNLLGVFFDQIYLFKSHNSTSDVYIINNIVPAYLPYEPYLGQGNIIKHVERGCLDLIPIPVVNLGSCIVYYSPHCYSADTVTLTVMAGLTLSFTLFNTHIY